MKRLKYLIPILGMILLASACTEQYATPTADEHICVYDGSDRGGQKLKFQLPAGSEAKKIDDNDIVVRIPASNRFFMAAKDDSHPNLRDPRAPQFYETFAARSVKVQIEGQVRFRFRGDTDCEWFSKHGRRNAVDGRDMQFNARGPNAESSPWLQFLAENFGTGMQTAADQVAGRFDPYGLVFHYPVNADDLGTVPAGQEPGAPADQALAKALGPVFTQILNSRLGGEYFCGIDPNPNDPSDTCPDLSFEIIAVHTSNSALEQGRQDVEQTKDALRNAQAKGELERQQADALAASSAAHQALLDQQLAEAKKQAEINDAQCLARAERGLDCDGHRPPVIVNGQEVN